MKHLIVIFLFLGHNFANFGVIAQNRLDNNYQSILTKYVSNKGPGVAVIMVKNGEILFESARGMANIEHQVPLTTNSVFRLGSITKQFTAAAIMMLQEQGRLNVKDDMKKYVPDFPTEGNTITIEHLLTHTSGLANYTDDHDLFSLEIQVPIDLDKMLKRFEEHPMPHKTGEVMQYSNTGYVLLGKIIEVASGQTYADFIENEIFKKLDMNSSQYGGEQIIANRANGYDKTADGVVNASHIDMSWPHAAGSLLSTVGDLNIWFKALRSGKIISDKSYQQMIKPFQLNDGTFSDYGYGIRINKLNKYDTVEHGGGIPGFVTWAVYIPTEDLYVAALTNAGNGDPGVVARSLIAKVLNIPLPNFEPYKIAHSKAKTLLGSYSISEDSERTLLLEDGKYYTQRDGGRKFEVIPFSQEGFYYDNSLTYIQFDKNEKQQQVMNFYYSLIIDPQKAVKE
ncbi:MAG: beta-lactamase family protein [Kangiellaceae bacterium]|nr:beta-lactamase family protein [Kangiellaceae bacterium]